METGEFRKAGQKHVVSSAGFEVKWDIPEAIAYIEPPRRMEFSTEGYWEATKSGNTTFSCRRSSDGGRRISKRR